MKPESNLPKAGYDVEITSANRGPSWRDHTYERIHSLADYRVWVRMRNPYGKTMGIQADQAVFINRWSICYWLFGEEYFFRRAAERAKERCREKLEEKLHGKQYPRPELNDRLSEAPVPGRRPSSPGPDWEQDKPDPPPDRVYKEGEAPREEDTS